MSDYTIVRATEVEDAYADGDVPGEFRSLTKALGADQVAVTLIRIPPHSDFEQGTGHRHEEIEEIYLVTKGALTMRFGDEVETVGAGSAVRVPPQTLRSHRNEGEEPVELWPSPAPAARTAARRWTISGTPPPRRPSIVEPSISRSLLSPRGSSHRHGL